MIGHQGGRHSGALLNGESGKLLIKRVLVQPHGGQIPSQREEMEELLNLLLLLNMDPCRPLLALLQPHQPLSTRLQEQPILLSRQ